MNKNFSLIVKEKIKRFNKSINIPGDKSLSIRALLLGSQCIGSSQIKNLLESEDVLDCKRALEKLGVKAITLHPRTTYQKFTGKRLTTD